MHIVTAAEMYATDRYTIEQIGMSAETLMESAGQAAARVLIQQIAPHARIGVMAGAGNNGGDGIVIARLLKSYGYSTDLWLIPLKEKITGTAKTALNIYENCGYEVKSYTDNETEFDKKLESYDVIVDALLGIGVTGELRSPYSEIIDKINKREKCEVYSIDMPSGVLADTGAVHKAVQADVTITIQSPKLSAFLFPAAGYYGKLVNVDIGIPTVALEKNSSVRLLWNETNVVRTLPIRERSSHKGTYGKGMVIGGSRNMTGAIMMTALAALRSGAGLTTMAIPDEIYSVVASHIPEVMYFPCSSHNGHFSGEINLDDIDVDAIAVGPGMGRTIGTKKITEKVLRQNVPVVLDADALYFWSEYAPIVSQRNEATILTPHPGEMARILNRPIRDIESKRFEVAKDFAIEYGVYLVLKGPNTIVTTPDGKQYVNPTGNPSLAKGGSGDVLTGMILAFIMQHHNIQEAISNAVFIHGKAADMLLEKTHSYMDVLATDVIEEIPQTLFKLVGQKR